MRHNVSEGNERGYVDFVRDAWGSGGCGLRYCGGEDWISGVEFGA